MNTHTATLLSLLLAGGSSNAGVGAPQDALVLAGRGAAGFEIAAVLPQGATPPWTVPLPFESHRPGRARLVADSRGVRLRLWCARPEAAGGLDAIRLRAVRHPVGSELLESGGRFRLVGPALLPRSVTPAEALPLVARLDGLAAERGLLELQRPEDLPEEAARVVIGGSDRDWQVLLTPGDGEDEKPIGQRVDQVFWAEVRDLEELEIVELRLRGSALLPTTEWQLQPTAARTAWAPSWADQRGPADGARARGHLRLAELDDEALTWGAGRGLELLFEAPPEAPAGQTWTLLASLGGSAELGDRAPTEPPWPGRFRDRSAELAPAFAHLTGPAVLGDIRSVMGPGLAFGDADGDGWPDLYLVQGAGREGSEPPHNRLLFGAEEGFHELPGGAGCEDTGAGMGALFFDAEGDGDLDLFVANRGADSLYANGGEGRFEDRSDPSGVGGEGWSAQPVAADLDRDGDLDLLVTGYLLYDADPAPLPEDGQTYLRDDPPPMLPHSFTGERDRLLVNQSTAAGLHFVEPAGHLGLDERAERGLGALGLDLDRDGRADLCLAVDVGANRLLRGVEGGFEDISFAAGLDDARGSRGLAAGDVDGDGDADLLVTNWHHEPNALYLNGLFAPAGEAGGVARFDEVGAAAGLAAYGERATSWGAELFDADLDGDLDLFLANGASAPAPLGSGLCAGQANHYFAGDGAGRFEWAAGDFGPDLDERLASRAALACDWDRDGDLDLAVSANNGRLQLLQNQTIEGGHAGHWLGVRLRGAGANPFGVGAEVTLRAGERLWRKSLGAGTGYLSGNPPELHFGLGRIEELDELVVRWPSGAETRHQVESLDEWITLQEVP